MDVDALQAWVADVTDGTVTGWQRAPSGGSRHTYFTEITLPDGTIRSLVTRAEGAGSFTGTEVTVGREAAVYRALASTPVPVPGVVAVSADGTVVLMERVAGTSDLTGLDPAQMDTVLAAMVDVIADLHSLDVATLTLPDLACPRSIPEHATLDIGMWARLASEGVPDLDPLLRFAGAFLAAHPPESVARTSLLHGDTGPGNFMTDGQGVTALVDMEFSHIGDPMDDIAWILMRAESLPVAMQSAIKGPLLERYTQKSGIPVNWRSVAYYEVAVQYRCGLTTSLALAKGGGARGWAPYLLVTQRYLLGVASCLASYLGIPPLEIPRLDLEPTPRTDWYDQVIQGLRAAARSIPDPDLSNETRNQQILLHYLRAYDRYGAAVADLEQADALDSLGLAAHDADAIGKLAEAGGAAGDLALLSYLLRRTGRGAVLWQTLLERPRR